MGEITIHVRWRENEWQQIDFVTLKYTIKDRKTASATLVVSKNLITFLIPGMWLMVKYDADDVWEGKLGEFSEQGNDTISFSCPDLASILSQRLIDIRSAEFINDVKDKVVDMETSQLVQQIFKIYTGKDETDSDYDVDSFVVPSSIAKRWHLTKDLFASCVELAEASAVSTDILTYSFWIQAGKKVHFAPQGYGRLWKDVIMNGKAPVLDVSSIANRILLRGGVPDTVPSDGLAFINDIDISSDNDWEVASSGEPFGTKTLTKDSNISFNGEYSVRVQYESTNNAIPPHYTSAYLTIGLDFNGLGSNFYTDSELPTIEYDLSDGEGSSQYPVEKFPSIAGQTIPSAKGNMTLAYITCKVKFAQDSAGTIPLDGTGKFDAPSVSAFIRSGTDTLQTIDIPATSTDAQTGTPHLTRLNIESTTEWLELNCTFRPDAAKEGNLDVTDIRQVGIAIQWGSAEVKGYVWIDEFQLHFHEVNVIQQDTASVVKYDIQEKRFQNRNINNWKAAHAVAKGILSKLVTPKKQTTVDRPFNPSIKINDRAEIDLFGKKVELIITEIEVNVKGTSSPEMKLKMGTETISTSSVLNLYRLIELDKHKGGTGYKLAKPYISQECKFFLCEACCELDCLIDNDQTKTKLLTDAGVEDSDPCITDCQTIVESF